MTADRNLAPGQRDFAEARRLLAEINPGTTSSTDAIVCALRAQVHATLALTAVTARQGMDSMPAPEFHSWQQFLVTPPGGEPEPTV